MFRGINTVSVDNKGRLPIPIKYREILTDNVNSVELIVTIDTEEACLLMYPLNCWQNIEQRLAALPSFNPAARRIQRLLIGHATEILLDSQGRILLPQELRNYAKLEKKVVLVGQGKKIEIWDLNHWNEKKNFWLEDDRNKISANLHAEIQSLSL